MVLMHAPGGGPGGFLGPLLELFWCLKGVSPLPLEVASTGAVAFLSLCVCLAARLGRPLPDA